MDQKQNTKTTTTHTTNQRRTTTMTAMLSHMPDQIHPQFMRNNEVDVDIYYRGVSDNIIFDDCIDTLARELNGSSDGSSNSTSGDDLSSIEDLSALSSQWSDSRSSKKEKSSKTIVTKASNNNKPRKIRPAGIHYDRRADGKIIPHIIVPRILKNDIRRDYASMFANVFNAFDEKLIQSYLDQFYRPDLLFIENCMFDQKNPHFDKEDEKLVGIPEIAKFWFSQMSSTSDFIFTISDTKLTLRSDHTSLIVFEFMMRGTKILTAEEFQKKMQQKMNTTKETTSSSTTIQSTTMENDDDLTADIIFSNDGEVDFITEEDLQFLSNEIDIEEQQQQSSSSLSRDSCMFEDYIKENIQFQQLIPVTPPIVQMPYSSGGTIRMHVDRDSKIYLLEFLMNKFEAKLG